MKATIGISQHHIDGVVKKIDNDNFFQLGKETTERRELFNFAVALGINKGFHTAPESKVSFYRTENVGNSLYLYSSLFYQENVLSHDDIDQLTDHDAIIELAEEYAQEGFNVIKEKRKTDTEESFMYELLNEMDEMYKAYFNEDVR